MFDYSKWMNDKWGFGDWNTKDWHSQDWYSKNWYSKIESGDDWFQHYGTAWINNWLQDSWGSDELWQGLDLSLNTSINSKLKKDICYGDKPWQKLDIYTPLSNDESEKPVLIFFYGGGWHDGNKEKYRYVAHTFTELGYVVVIPDYVKYPTGKFPDFIYDGAQTLSWVKNNITRYGGDKTTLCLAGHSAGAHLGALLLSDKRYLDTVNMTKKDVKAFVGLAGPYDFTPLIKRYCDVFDDPDLYPDIRVSNFVDGDEPPMMLAQAGADMIVGSYTCEPLLNALQKVDVPFESKTYSKMGHMGIVLALSPSYNNDKTVIDDIHSFLKKHTE
ncbi:MAG: acetyl esterase/lipase [Cellvibrionaceae bacterium]|jgi:acetyl esterase/lipase